MADKFVTYDAEATYPGKFVTYDAEATYPGKFVTYDAEATYPGKFVTYDAEATYPGKWVRYDELSTNPGKYVRYGERSEFDTRWNWPGVRRDARHEPSWQESGELPRDAVFVDDVRVVSVRRMPAPVSEVPPTQADAETSDE